MEGMELYLGLARIVLTEMKVSSTQLLSCLIQKIWVVSGIGFRIQDL